MFSSIFSKKSNLILALTLSLVLSLSISVSAWWIFGGNEDKQKESNQQAEVRVIEHAMGKTKIKGTPQRIVTLYQGANDAAVALGVKPVGVVDSWVEKPM